MRLIVTGAKGRLGRTLTEKLNAQGHEVAGFASDDLNVTDFAAANRRIGEFRPDVIFHTAAWTNVDGCTRDPERAVLVNGLGTQNVAVAAAAVGAAVLYVSSNEVFDGTASRPYREYDITKPANPYGYSKWVGEQALAQVNPRHYIVRTSWLFAHGGSNFIQKILSVASAGSPLRVVTDEIASPTYTDDFADALIQLVETERFGTYHLPNEGACSRYEFARYALNRAGYGTRPITPISASEWQRPSTPPAYSPLENMAARSIGITLRPWQEAVDAFLEREQLLAHER